MTNNKKPSRQEMIDSIYEKIARKDLSFGCEIKKKNIYFKILWSEVGWNFFLIWPAFKQYLTTIEDIAKCEIIWHPVMIGDVMDFIERNFPDWIHCIECKKWKILSDNFNDDTIFYCDNEDCEFLSKFYWDEAFCHNMELYDWFWEEKRKPITEQSDECVKFVYNLISE